MSCQAIYAYENGFLKLHLEPDLFQQMHPQIRKVYAAMLLMTIVMAIIIITCIIVVLIIIGILGIMEIIEELVIMEK